MSSPDIVKEQISSIHKALSNRFPLPEPTVKKLISHCFGDIKWKPKQFGFSRSTNVFKLNNEEERMHEYLVPTQQLQALIDGSFITDNLNKEDKKIQEKLRNIRQNCLTNDDDDLRNHVHCVLDAIFHYDYLSDSKTEILIESLKNWKNNLSSIEEYYITIDFQLTEQPRGSTINILTKNPEPEYTNLRLYAANAFMTLVYTLDKEIKTIQKTLDFNEDMSEDMSDLELLIEKICHIWTRFAIQNVAPRPPFKVDLKDLKNSKESENLAAAKDGLVYRILHDNALANFKPDFMKSHFDNLIENATDNTELNDVKESLEMFRDYLLPSEKSKLELLEKHHSNSLNEFRKGLINYLMGCLIEIDNPERYQKLMNSISVFHKEDPIRLHNALQAMVAGYLTIYDENQTARRESEPMPNIIPHFSLILRELLDTDATYSPPMIKHVVEELNSYLEFRLAFYRTRCQNCQKVHPERRVDKIEFEISNKNEVLEIIDLLKEIKKQYSTVDTSQTIELFTVAGNVIYGFDLPLIYSGDEPISKELNYMMNDSETPEHLLSLYRLDSIELEDMFAEVLSFLIHITELHIGKSDMKEQINGAIKIFEKRQEKEENLDKNIIKLVHDSLKSLDLESSRKNIIQQFEQKLEDKFVDLMNDNDSNEIQSVYLSIMLTGSRILKPSVVNVERIISQFESVHNHLIDTTENLPESILSILIANWNGFLEYSKQSEVNLDKFERYIKASIGILLILLEVEDSGLSSNEKEQLKEIKKEIQSISNQDKD